MGQFAIFKFLPLGVLLLNIFAAGLVIMRGPAFGTKVYRPMLLNIGLSIAPSVVMAVTLVAGLLSAAFAPSRITMFLIFAVGGLIWLLFLPNAAYLITELNLSHRRPNEHVPMWYDIILVLTLAISGVMNTLTNIALAQFVLMGMTSPNVDVFENTPTALLGTVLIIFLVVFGIYLGRYIRFNSWDLAHPISFVKRFAKHFSDAENRRNAGGFFLTHATFLCILYLIVIAPFILMITGATAQ
jgi:uncharacterized membrane protein